MAIQEREKMAMDPARKAQIKAQHKTKDQNRAQVGALIFDEASMAIQAVYSDYSNVFSAENEAEFSEYTGINDYAIELVKDKQPSFGPIYNLGQVELETLKTYIITNLANGFICPSKSLIRAFILFNKKPDVNLCFCVDYWSFNNLTIKNQYPLPLIGKSLNWLNLVKQFTQLDLTNAYHWIRIYESDK